MNMFFFQHKCVPWASSDGIVSLYVIVREETVTQTLDTVPQAVERIVTDQDVSFVHVSSRECK